MLRSAARSHAIAFGLLLLLFLLYAAYFIYRTSFVIDGERWFVLFDDAMISMRYAKNLAEGHGLAWNAGAERVEGYTNLLWTLYMALLHLLQLPAPKISAAVQASSLVLLLANLVVVRSVAQRLSGSQSVAWCAAFLTAAYYPLDNWALQGLEVGALALWVSTCVWWMLRVPDEPRLFRRLCWILGLGTFLRGDAVVVALPIALYAAWVRADRRRSLGWMLAVVGGCVLLQTLWRLAYYGELLPNTYHLKLSGYALGARLARGTETFLDFAAAMRWVVFAPLLLLLWRRDKALLAVFATFGVQVLYSIQVGGDAWEWSGGSNRFIAIVMPMFLVLSSMLLGDVYGALARRVSRTGPARVALLALLRAGGVASVLALLVALNYHGSLRQSIERWTLRQRPLYVLENRQHVKLAREVERLTTTDATLAVVWAGSLPYYTGRTCVDLLGKSDRTVARGPVRMEPGAGPRPALEPGHFKWDYDHSLGSGKPDVIVETWYRMETHPEWAHYFAHDLGLSGSVYVREGSQHIRLPEADLLASREWWRGLWLEQRGDLDAAIAAFVHAIATGPYNETWRYRFGKLLVEQRPLADVEAYYDSTAQRDPKPQTSHFFRAVALAQAGRFDEAIAWFERALEVDPAHEMSHEAWGDVLVAQGRLAEATLHYNAALRILPEYRSARLRLADALSRLGRMNDAERERSIARNQVELTDARRYFSWGKFLLDIGRPEAAAAELERALAVDPDNREAKRLLHQARGATHAAADRHR